MPAMFGVEVGATIGTIAAAWGALGAAAWVAGAVAGIRALGSMERLAGPEVAAPVRWPALSVVVAARDEAERIEPAVGSILEQDYPDLEVVVVDDRSRDGTHARLARLAERHRRLVVRRVTTLPEGWLGKVHALHVGLGAASGELVLFTDADVHFAPGALRRAVARLERDGLDHLAVAPRVTTRGLLHAAVNATFAAMFCLGTRVEKIGTPGSDAWVGIGAFNLVRRATLDRTPGLEWLRLELLDDVGVGYMLHRAGARAALLDGTGALEIEWYPSLGAMLDGLDKNMYAAIGRLRLPRVLAFAGGITAVALAPFAALAARPPGFAIAAVVALAASAASGVAAARRGERFLAAFLAPFVLPVLAYSALRSAIRAERRGGIAWRDTFYGLDRLRAGQRVRLGPSPFGNPD